MLHSPTRSVTTASVSDGRHVNDMLTSDWLLRSFELRDRGGAHVALVGDYLEHFSWRRSRFFVFFRFSVVLSAFQDAAVEKVFDWLVIIRQINKLVN